MTAQCNSTKIRSICTKQSLPFNARLGSFHTYYRLYLVVWHNNTFLFCRSLQTLHEPVLLEVGTFKTKMKSGLMTLLRGSPLPLIITPFDARRIT